MRDDPAQLPSEKVEIARRIEDALAGRVGNNQHRKEEVQIFAPAKDGEKSRDAAASAVGWSGETYRKAKAVVESGNDELVEAMDSGAFFTWMIGRGTPARAPGLPVVASAVRAKACLDEI